MLSFLKRLPGFIGHPFLIILFALLSLLVANYGRLLPSQALRPLLVITLLAMMLLVLIRWLVKDWHAAGWILSLSLILFFSYGHLYGLVEGHALFGIMIGRHRFLLPFFTVLWLVLIYLVAISKRHLAEWTKWLNLIALLLVVVQLGQIGRAAWQSDRQRAQVENTAAVPVQNAPVVLHSNIDEQPDIYFIILDTYTRQDSYQEVLDFDNSAFLAALRDRGFNIADCSLSNYNATSASLLASLDMQYLSELYPPLGTGYKNLSYLDPYLQNNRVMQSLRSIGYTLVAFESGYMPTEFINAQVYLAPSSGNLLTGGLNRYESLVLQSSAGILVYDFSDHLPGSIRYFLDAPYVAHRERILYQFDQLGRLAEIHQPKFVFAHILAPHTPFVFTGDGQPVVRDTPFTLNDDPELYDRELYRQRFIDQTIFVNSRVLKMLDEILAQPGDPVIILQGDHGLPSSGEWVTTILNAIRLPGGETSLYPTRSPVNTFRLVFNQLFDSGMELSPDRSCRFKRGDPASCEVFGEPSPQCALP